jgi:hypothetical protein
VRKAERFADKVSRRPSPRRCVAASAGIGLDQPNQVVDRVRRHRRVDHDHQGGEDRERDQVEVLFEFMGNFAAERGIDHVTRVDQLLQSMIPISSSLVAVGNNERSQPGKCQS